MGWSVRPVAVLHLIMRTSPRAARAHSYASVTTPVLSMPTICSLVLMSRA